MEVCELPEVWGSDAPCVQGRRMGAMAGTPSMSCRVVRAKRLRRGALRRLLIDDQVDVVAVA